MSLKQHKIENMTGRTSCGLHYDYYWRDYTGNIPTDAVEGGLDVNNKTTYIGQVYVHKFGISTVTIYPGKTSVICSVHKVYSVWNFVKILCSSSKQNLRWVSTNAKNFHVDMIGKHVVRGGVEGDGLITNIGKIFYQGEVVVAKVCGFDLGKAVLRHFAENTEKCVDAYAVLVYEMNKFDSSYPGNRSDGDCSNIGFPQQEWLERHPMDYYWRDYTGEIPYDAVPGGSDVNNKTTYIGQVYVKSLGINPVTIYPGKASVIANMQGLHHLSSYIKILCSSSKDRFKWLPTDSKNLHVQMIHKHLVRGGVESDLVTNIGRILYQGEIKVAKVCGYNVGDAKLFFPAGNKEESAEAYEVLVYDNTNNLVYDSENHFEDRYVLPNK